MAIAPVQITDRARNRLNGCEGLMRVPAESLLRMVCAMLPARTAFDVSKRVAACCARPSYKRPLLAHRMHRNRWGIPPGQFGASRCC